MSVRKRKWTTTKGQEKEAWVVDYVDGQGKRRQKSFQRKKEADAFASDASVEVRQGTHVADSASVTVEQASKLWIESAVATGLERSTVDQYRQHSNLHILPFLGSKRLSQLTVPMVRGFEDELKGGNKSLKEQPRSSAMVRKVLTSLSSLLADAQERGLVARNVVRDMRSGRKGRDRKIEKRKRGRYEVGVDIPLPDEIKAIVQHATGQWRPILIAAIFTGLRASELRGLRWQDVDLENKVIHVRQRADRYNQIGKPKTAAATRSVPLSPIVVNTLKEWRLACPRPASGKYDENGKPVPETAKQSHLMFPNGVGKVQSLANIINRGLIPTQIAAKVTKNGKAKYTGMHALRHFYASWSINRKEDGGLGLPPKTVQERMGHSSITMTMDIYGHLFPKGDDFDELAAAEEALLS